jgi:hypothetical protein
MGPPHHQFFIEGGIIGRGSPSPAKLPGEEADLLVGQLEPVRPSDLLPIVAHSCDKEGVGLEPPEVPSHVEGGSAENPTPIREMVEESFTENDGAKVYAPLPRFMDGRMPVRITQ